MLPRLVRTAVLFAAVLAAAVAAGVLAVPGRPPAARSAAREVLGRPCGLTGPVRGKPLREVFAALSEKHGVKVRLDLAEYTRVEGNPRSMLAGEDPLDLTVGDVDVDPALPVRQVLRQVLAARAQLGGLGFGFRPSGDEILVGPAFDPTRLTEADSSVVERRYGPPVWVDMSAPLAAVVGELRRQTGANIALDPRAPADLPVELKVDNARLLTALQVLAAFADLTVVPLDEVYLLTTPAAASRLRADRTADPLPEPPGESETVFIGPCGPGAGAKDGK